MKLNEARKQVERMQCPICCSQSFDLKMRCDLGYEECHATVRCASCGHEFDTEDLSGKSPEACQLQSRDNRKGAR